MLPLCASILFTGCSASVTQTADANLPSPSDAYAADASIALDDAEIPSDARSVLDAARLDAGPPLGGCFTGDVELPSRISLRGVHGLVGHSRGWIVFGVSETGSGRALFLDREGGFVDQTEYDRGESELTQFFLHGESVYAFGLDSVVRFDIGARGFDRIYERVELRRGSVGRLGDGFRVIGHLLFRGNTPSVTDITPDDASPTGMRMITATLPSVDFLEASEVPASVSVVEDHLQVRHVEGIDATSMRVVDVQIGAPAGGDGMVGVRVWSTETVPWNHALIAMTADASRWVGTTRASLETERVVEVVGRDRSWPLFSGEVVRGWDESEGRYVVLTDNAFHVFRGEDVVPLGAEVPFSPIEGAWPNLSVTGDFAAATFERSADGAGQRFGLRCIRLPTL